MVAIEWGKKKVVEKIRLIIVKGIRCSLKRVWRIWRVWCENDRIRQKFIKKYNKYWQNEKNVYIGAIAAYNDGIINNCFDDVLYDIKNFSISYFDALIDCEPVEEKKSYSIEDKLGIHLVGQEGSSYSNVKSLFVF